MNDTITVYVAAFNAEKTLKKTIDSLLAQTYKNVQIFIGDNGSTDRTPEIIKEYTSKYSSITSVRRENNFCGSFMYTLYGFMDALDIPSNYSDWICWVDSDDTVEPTYLEDMLRFAKENELDMVTCGWNFVRPDRVDLRVADHDEVIYRGEFASRLRDYDKFMGPVWNKLFRTKTFATNIAYYENKYAKIFRDGVYYYGADTAFNYLYLGNNREKFGLLAKPLYNYYIWDTSTSRKNFNPMRIIADRRMAEIRFDFLKDLGGEISKENYEFIMNIYFKSTSATMELLLHDDRYDLTQRMEQLHKMFHCRLMDEYFDK